MKIAIISDTHNHLANLHKTLRIIEDEDIHTIIHCGDVTTTETLSALSAFRVILTFGNGDFTSGEMREALLNMNPDSYAGSVFQGEIDGLRIAVTHGHLYSQFQTLLNSQQFDLLFHGHTHRREDTLHGNTRRINPGALGGLRKEERSFCIFDTHSRQLRFILLD
jgi:putative phosphoesterase